ncbi:fucolectin-5 isoform X2 [Microcaecilia unicolor]|uniref:Fucolectin-5-like isoform X2 n=1 Tax=Microcaecilia unicolor TaxID=1415580 RepID=A0A6P7ZSY0_9AMPH|nr:fucolectin-5-like isoform X2 [Microcaecilia unicolor]
MHFPLILLLGIGVYRGIEADSDCSPRPGEKNIASTGVATQSSLYLKDFPRLANDGIRSTYYYKGFCSCTTKESNPWWRLDLQRTWKIRSVVLVNPSDCCINLLWGAQIRIGNRSDNNNPVCGTITNAAAGSSTRLCCAGMEGRYVSVVIPGRKEWLSLCEVEVYPMLQDESECL